MSAAHYLVIDFEATCSNDAAVPRNEMEIIEIGAVLVDGISLAAIGEFQTFVKPVVQPQLTAFCIELTSITQADVDSAPLFPQALGAMTDWLALRGDFVFCSWGDYDRKQLLQDCARHGVPYPFDERHINLKAEFARKFNRRRQGLDGALKSLQLTLAGTHHRGIDDARNIARLLPHVYRSSLD